MTFVPLEFPPQILWGQRRGAHVAERPKGPNGKRLCGWCDSALPKYRRAWCSDVCQGKFYRVWSWGALRTYIIERDKVCRRCGSEHPGWETTGWRWMTRTGRADEEGARCMLQKTAWNVDHILPVLDGGTDDPANLRLLCKRCHIAVGYEQRAARRKPRDCRHEPPFPPQLVGVMCLLSDPELVAHAADRFCSNETPHYWNVCPKVKSLR